MRSAVPIDRQQHSITEILDHCIAPAFPRHGHALPCMLVFYTCAIYDDRYRWQRPFQAGAKQRFPGFRPHRMDGSCRSGGRPAVLLRISPIHLGLAGIRITRPDVSMPRSTAPCCTAEQSVLHRRAEGACHSRPLSPAPTPRPSALGRVVSGAQISRRRNKAKSAPSPPASGYLSYGWQGMAYVCLDFAAV